MQSYNQLRENDKVRMTVNQHIEEFFKKGGKITHLAHGQIAVPVPSGGAFVINPRKSQGVQPSDPTVEDRIADL